MTTPDESILCSICNKSPGKRFCIGCKSYFCSKDFKQHEQQLSIKFDDEVVRFHDQILDQIQKFEKSDHMSSDLFAQIEQWKIRTINKVEKAAERAHLELSERIDKQKITITKQAEAVTKEIRSYREEENFVETDIDRLKTQIDFIQQQVEQLTHADTTKLIIIQNDQIDWDRIIYIISEAKTDAQTRITFADISNTSFESTSFPQLYNNFKWTGFYRMHKQLAMRDFQKSAYVLVFTSNDSPYIAYCGSGSITAQNSNQVFDIISLKACTAWNDNVKLDIKGYRNSEKVYDCNTTLVYGKPQLISLQWTGIHKIDFQTIGGTRHPDSSLNDPTMILSCLTVKKPY